MNGLICMKPFDVVGFATFTDFWGVPEKMIQFIQSIPQQQKKPAFVFTTFGMVALFSMRDLGREAAKQGFELIAGFTLHTPENYPPMICSRMAMEDSPHPKELATFKRVLEVLNQKFEKIKSGQSVPAINPGETFLLSLFSAPERTKARKSMGQQFVDQALCIKCGICKEGCPYHAIILEPFPKFDRTLCYGCWACFHHCPQKAIYTAKFRGRGHYPKPIGKLVGKL